MKIAIIIPAYNEEEFLPVTLNSLVNQSHAIDKILVVNDGSTDNTENVCKEFAQNYSNIDYVTNVKKEKRASGSKIVRAFELGLKEIPLSDYDLIAKIDSDIGFPPEYFEKIIRKFENTPRLGLYGGICQILDGENWKDEKVANLDHVRGALKTYRVKAFNQMNGLQPIMGWDSIDEFLLRYYKWEVACDASLKVKHYRVTHSINGWYIESKLNGEVFNNLGYNVIVSLISALKRGLTKKPYFLTGMVTMMAYLKIRLKMKPGLLDKNQKQFINQYRMKSYFKKLKQQ
jgi:glycosyltransferase involved in cell wall biosynthesis